MSLVKTKVN